MRNSDIPVGESFTDKNVGSTKDLKSSHKTQAYSGEVTPTFLSEGVEKSLTDKNVGSTKESPTGASLAKRKCA
jgi:hypothetical protein